MTLRQLLALAATALFLVALAILVFDDTPDAQTVQQLTVGGLAALAGSVFVERI